MIKCCVFDLDGTLLDTIATITYYVNLVFSKRNIEKITEHECKYFVGSGAKLLISRALKSRGIEDEKLAAEILGEYSAAYSADTLYLTEPYADIEEMLSLLAEKGIKLAVLSNKPDVHTKDLVAKFFPSVFKTVQGAAAGVALKPSPDALFAIFARLSVSPREVLYIGDSEVDMQTGRNAGAGKTVGVSWGFRTREELIESGADVICDSPLEILKEVGV